MIFHVEKFKLTKLKSRVIKCTNDQRVIRADFYIENQPQTEAYEAFVKSLSSVPSTSPLSKAI